MRLYRTVLWLVIFLGMAMVGQVEGQVASEKQKDIQKLMELTGAGQMAVQVMNQMIPLFKRQHAGVPDRFWEDFMKGIDSNDLIDLIVPVYDKHLTHQDIKELIQFYESPVGRKLTRVQPLIMQESMVVGQTWGRKLAEQVFKKLAEEGLIKSGQ